MVPTVLKFTNGTLYKQLATEEGAPQQAPTWVPVSDSNEDLPARQALQAYRAEHGDPPDGYEALLNQNETGAYVFAGASESTGEPEG